MPRSPRLKDGGGRSAAERPTRNPAIGLRHALSLFGDTNTRPASSTSLRQSQKQRAASRA
jgi:hypothetical protein